MRCTTSLIPLFRSIAATLVVTVTIPPVANAVAHGRFSFIADNDARPELDVTDGASLETLTLVLGRSGQGNLMRIIGAGPLSLSASVSTTSAA